MSTRCSGKSENDEGVRIKRVAMEECIMAKLWKGRHDLVLMNMQILEMDGLEACWAILNSEEATSSGKKLPMIVFVSAHVSSDYEAVCWAAGGVDFSPSRSTSKLWKVSGKSFSRAFLPNKMITTQPPFVALLYIKSSSGSSDSTVEMNSFDVIIVHTLKFCERGAYVLTCPEQRTKRW